MFNEYPYTDYHELNTDWIIGKIKNVETAEANTKQYAEDADAAKVAAQDARDIAVAAKDTAVEAKDDAVEAKDDAVSFLTDTKDQLDLLQSRVDNIIPDGTQTAGNLELLDIRVGYDSTAYASAGDAVRGQISDLHTDVNDINSVINDITEVITSSNVLNPATIIRGQRPWASDGQLHADATAFASDFIKVNPGDVIRWYRLINASSIYGPGSTVMWSFCEYSAADESTFISGIANVNTYTVTSGNYIRIGNYLTFIDNDLYDAITINQEVDLTSIEPYYSNTYPIDNPQVTQNAADISDLKAVTAIGSPMFKSRNIKYPLLSGQRTDLYYQNALYGSYNKFVGAYCGMPGFLTHADSISCTPDDNTITASVNNVLYEKSVNNTKILTYYLQQVKSTFGDGNTAKCLLIGDSLTDMGKYQKYAADYFDNSLVTVNWLGTRVSSYGLRHEGRSGWRAYTYTHFAATTPGDNEGIADTNPFWDPNAGKFDFSYYMTSQGYSSVDIVFINLGTNDFARSNHVTPTDVKDSWQEIIDSIHAYDPNIHIVLWMCPMPCIMLGVDYQVNHVYKMHSVIYDNFVGNSWGHNRIWVMPSYLALDPVYGFPTQQVARNQFDPTLITEPTDTTHPSDIGFHQLALPIIAMIRYLIN